MLYTGVLMIATEYSNIVLCGLNRKTNMNKSCVQAEEFMLKTPVAWTDRQEVSVSSKKDGIKIAQKIFHFLNFFFNNVYIEGENQNVRGLYLLLHSTAFRTLSLTTLDIILHSVFVVWCSVYINMG